VGLDLVSWFDPWRTKEGQSERGKRKIDKLLLKRLDWKGGGGVERYRWGGDKERSREKEREGGMKSETESETRGLWLRFYRGAGVGEFYF
jgi:hypothetical protein